MKFFILKMGSYLLNLLPNRLVLFLGDTLGSFWFYVLPFRRKVVVANLTLAFGSTKSPKEIRVLAARNFKHYGRALFESIRSVVWQREDYIRRVDFQGIEHLQALMEKKQGAFLLSFHMGAWEVSPGSVAARGIPIDVVTKVAVNAGANDALNWFRNRLDIGIIPASRSKQQIIDSITSGRFIGFMLDQFMGPPVGVPVKFFGQTAGTTASLALLSEQNSFPVLLGFTYRGKKGKLCTVIEPLATPPLSEALGTRIWEKTQFFNDCIEAKVRQFPEQWMWLHRRWKPFVGEPKWQPGMISAPTPA